MTDEYLAAIRAIWTEAAPAYRGRFAAFERVQAHPQPVQKPTPPIVIGGHTKAAFRRAVQQGHGWYGFALDTSATTRCLEGLREAAASVTRPPELPRSRSACPRADGSTAPPPGRSPRSAYTASSWFRRAARPPASTIRGGNRVRPGRTGLTLERGSSSLEHPSSRTQSVNVPPVSQSLRLEIVVCQPREERRDIRIAGRWSPVDLDDLDALGLELLRENLEPDIYHEEWVFQEAVRGHAVPARSVRPSSGFTSSAAKRAAWALDGRT